MTQTVLLGDIGKVITGKTPPKANPEYWGGELDFITPTDFTGSKYINPKRQLSSEGRQALHRIVCPANSVIVTCIGSDMGKVALARSDYISNQQINSLVIDEEKADPNFIYYLLRLNRPLLRKYAESGGSTMPIINKSTFERLAFTIPDLEMQKKIADILGTIDEKIELNRQMNETLEQMGQALFRHYFIDNPEAEKWEKRELGEFFPIKTGKKDANFGTEDGEYPFFTCAQTISKAPDFSFDAHALLLAGNGDFNLKLYRGKFEAYQRTYVLIPNDEQFVGVLYFLMKMKLPEITGGSRGSVIKFITKGMIENYKFALPNDSELAETSEVFNQITVNIEENVKEIQTLTTLRDTLLPQLISGKVKV